MKTTHFELGRPFARSVPFKVVTGAREALRFAQARGYTVCYRTDTGKAHIAKPMGQTFPRSGDG